MQKYYSHESEATLRIVSNAAECKARNRLCTVLSNERKQVCRKYCLPGLSCGISLCSPHLKFAVVDSELEGTEVVFLLVILSLLESVSNARQEIQ